LHIGGYDDHDKAGHEITDAAEGLIEAPDLPSAEQKAARKQAKFLVRTLISGVHKIWLGRGSIFLVDAAGDDLQGIVRQRAV
jgi:hypothetical protein